MTGAAGGVGADGEVASDAAGATTGRDPRDLPGRGLSALIVSSTDGPDCAQAALGSTGPSVRMVASAELHRTFRTQPSL